MRQRKQSPAATAAFLREADARAHNQQEIPGLWLARAKPGIALKSQGTYWPAKAMNVLVQADIERHAQQAVIAFPESGAAYVVPDQRQLKGIINKLITVYNHIDAHGQSAVVSFGREN